MYCRAKDATGLGEDVWYKLAYKPPICGPCGRNEGFLGGLIAKGGLYASLYDTCPEEERERLYPIRLD